MFSGIIEQAQSLVREIEKENTFQVFITCPSEFNDLNVGDSIACDGVCLTLEAVQDQAMVFTLGPETLKILNWTPQKNIGKLINLERSLKFGERVHGHFVTGHVDGVGQVVDISRVGETQDVKIRVPEALAKMIWKKGSLAVQGVSLTVNDLSNLTVSVGLIPETLKRTNLGLLKVGDYVNLEVDPMARAFYQMAKEFYSV